MSGSSDPSASRIHHAGCEWDVQLCSEDLERLRIRDQGAWRVLVALMTRSSGSGLDKLRQGTDYRVPVGYKVRASEFKRRTKPWLGELKVDERTPKRASKPGQAIEHRLYFGEPEQPDNLVLGVSLCQKSSRDRDPANQQTAHIRQAMWALIFWCENRVPTVGWRAWK